MKNTAKKDENFLMFMRKFPQALLVTFQVEKWALCFCSLPDFPGELCQECFIHRNDKPGQHPTELTLKRSGSQTWTSVSFNPHPCLGWGQKSAFFFFFLSKLSHNSYAGGPQTTLAETVARLNLQPLALHGCSLVWLSNEKVASQFRCADVIIKWSKAMTLTSLALRSNSPTACHGKFLVPIVMNELASFPKCTSLIESQTWFSSPSCSLRT